ncbi:MAG: aspartate aminotransferase family protein [Desulfurococcales archaeon]|nr:aspartate aminotransferase family protein [Desulfurococcales archaeon]
MGHGDRLPREWREGASVETVLERLASLSKGDADPWSGRMFTHTYDTGLPEVLRVGWEAFKLYRDKTMLDFTVYPSLLDLERELVGFVGALMNAPEGFSGAFTYGGTESIIVSALAAREHWRRRGGRGRGRIVLPATGHPAFDKAAYLLGLEAVRVPVDPETLTADPAVVSEALGPDTVMVVASAVDYPFGGLDPVAEIGEEAEARDVWLHVDACLGGMVLAFASDLGEDVPPFDFRVEAVKSMSVDMHKYGYSPKGASLALFRSPELRAPTVFVDANWPGYPLVNEAILSTRSAAPLAAAWAVARLLGYEGYKRAAGAVLEARRAIERGVEELGFRVLGRPRAGVMAFTSDEVDIFDAASRLARAGWVVQLQPGNRRLGYPPSIHLTVSPVHARVVDEFLEALEEAARGAQPPRFEAEQLIESLGFEGLLGLAAEASSGGLDESMLRLVDELIHLLEPAQAEELIRQAVLRLFQPRL